MFILRILRRQSCEYCLFYCRYTPIFRTSVARHAEINFNLNPGEPNTPSKNRRNIRKSASVIDGIPADKSAHFGNVDTKQHDSKNPKPKASDIPARKQWNRNIPKIAADFIRLLFVCIHTGDPSISSFYAR